MKDRSIGVLLIGIVAVGLFIVAQEYWRAQKPKRDYQRIKVFDLQPQTLISVQFDTGESVIDCVKENGEWRVGESGQGRGRADVARVFSLIAGLNALGKGTTITHEQLELRGLDVAEYGFDPPELTIAIVDNRGRRVWEIGRTTPADLEVYVREAGGNEIYTIPSQFWKLIPKDPDDLRNRVLFSGEVAGVKRLEIRGESGFVRVVKEASRGWRIQQPIEAAADPYEVSTYIKNLHTVRIEDFIEENVSDLSAYGLQGETRQLSLGYSDESSKTLLVGDPIPGRPGLLYARQADDTSVFALKEDVVMLLFSLPENPFRDARVLSLDLNKISTIRVQHLDRKLRVSRNDSGTWELTTPVAWKADARAVSSLIDLWSKAVVTDYQVAPQPEGATWILDFVADETAGTNRIAILPVGDNKDGLIVRLNDDPTFFRINLPVVPNSIINPLFYKNKLVWKLSPAEIKKLILQRTGAEKQIIERGDDGTFVAMEAHGNAQIDSAAVDRIINRLGNITTTEYIAHNPRDLDIYGLSTPSAELYVGLTDSNELGRVLLIGRESPDGFFAMVKGSDVVFYLDKLTVEILTSDFVIKPEVSTQAAE
jgi:hypothetical protein